MLILFLQTEQPPKPCREVPINMKSAIILFDFDGTLADTFESGARLINQFAEQFGYSKIDFAKHKDLSARQLVKLSGVKWWQIPRLVRFFRRESAIHADEIKPFDGVVEMVQQLSQHCDVGILSTNSAETVGKFLTNNALRDYFHFIKTNVPLFGKSRALRRAVRFLRRNYTFILYVGDEIRDIEACRKVGLDIISVSWGFNSREALLASNKNVADSAEQLSAIILQTI